MVVSSPIFFILFHIVLKSTPTCIFPLRPSLFFALFFSNFYYKKKASGRRLFNLTTVMIQQIIHVDCNLFFKRTTHKGKSPPRAPREYKKGGCLLFSYWACWCMACIGMQSRAFSKKRYPTGCFFALNGTRQMCVFLLFFVNVVVVVFCQGKMELQLIRQGW